MSADLAEIRRAGALLLEPGTVAELRVIGAAKGVLSGYYDDRTALARDATRSSGRAEGVYVTLNPVLPALLARAQNRLVDRPKRTTSDQEILQRVRLLLDLDAARVAGVSATNDEHETALTRAREVRSWLKVEGWPSPLFADSGNGAHLVYAIELPNDAAASDLVKRALTALAMRFDDERVTVDRTTFNAARLVKCYGTIAAKGGSTADRPHRLARILEAPDRLVGVPQELLERLAALAPPESRGRAGRGISPAAVRAALEARGVVIAKQKPWAGSDLFELEVCPWNEAHRRTARVIVFADGGLHAACFHASCARRGWPELRAALGIDIGARGRVAATPDTPIYERTEHGLIYRKEDGDGVKVIPLTNFTARIVNNVVEDDATGELRRLFEIEAALNSHRELIRVSPADFVAMTWPAEHLGAGALVMAGFGRKDHARAAIQTLSGEQIPERRIYTHTGWRRRSDGAWVYLHAGGALGEKGALDGLEVALPSRLRRYRFPLPPAGDQRRIAVCASLKFLDVAPGRVTVPVYGAISRAVLGEADFSKHLAGATGRRKSEIAALVQQHFGAEMDARHLPAGWQDTPNSLEALLFAAKDALVVVDDFAPTGTADDIKRLHRDAARVFRASGNRAGRGRMRPDTTLQPDRPPRALALSTGEEIPRGQSVRARVFIIEVDEGDVDLATLTGCQRDAAAGRYAEALAAFICWLAPRYEETRTALRAEAARAREVARGRGVPAIHGRTIDIRAELLFSFRLFLSFASEIGAISAGIAETLEHTASTALEVAAAAQGEHHAASEPTARFLELLRTAITSGRAHVAGPDGDPPEMAQAWGWVTVTIGTGDDERSEWRQQGERVGWVSGDDVYLEPGASYVVAERLARDQGESIPVGPKTLAKRLDERGLLRTAERAHQRHTVRRNLQGAERRVLHLAKGTLMPPESDGSDESDGVRCN